MKNERSKSTWPVTSLDQRFAGQPEVIAQLHALRDEVERALTKGALAHEVEAMVQERMRELGRRVLAGWAGDDLQSPASQPAPGATKHSKKTPVANGLRPGRSHRANLALKAARAGRAALLKAARPESSRGLAAPPAGPG